MDDETRAEMAAAEERNAKIALELMADPRCTCDRPPQNMQTPGWPPSGLIPGDVIDYIPQPPRHRQGCRASES